MAPAGDRRAALVVVYNHRYDDNIDAVETIYRGRFSRIHHLVPFHDAPRPNVIGVYENSLCFQGYVAQSVDRVFDEAVSHYVYAADDILLNPAFDERNIVAGLGLDSRTSFLSQLAELHKGGYWRGKRAAVDFLSNARGSEGIRFLPSVEDAQKRFARHNLETANIALTGRQVYDIPPLDAEAFGVRSPRTLLHNCRALARNLHRRNRSFPLPYPLAGSYADLFVVAAANLRLFAHYCGILASMRLFVEVAIPTAMVLACDDIRTLKDTGFTSGALWSTGAIAEMESRYGRSVRRLIDDFPARALYIHPVKLSRWTLDPR